MSTKRLEREDGIYDEFDLLMYSVHVMIQRTCTANSHR